MTEPMNPYSRARHIALCMRLRDFPGARAHMDSAKASGYSVTAYGATDSAPAGQRRVMVSVSDANQAGAADVGTFEAFEAGLIVARLCHMGAGLVEADPVPAEVIP